MTIASRFAEFAAREAHGSSPAYERLATAVSRDAGVLALLATLTGAQQQPNLLFAVVRLLGGPVHDPAAFPAYVVGNWPMIEPELRTRITQTNEPARSALLVPLLAALPQPLALLEVGASAGLGLYPGGCDIVWRAGLDLNPLDVTDPADLAWLEALIWPEHTDRLARLRASVAIAVADPPHLIRGDLADDLPALADQAPDDATLVVFHTSVLYQVPPARRATFTSLVRTLAGHWISVEAPDVVVFDNLPPPPDATLHNVIALDGVPLAWARGHGEAVTWFSGRSARS